MYMNPQSYFRMLEDGSPRSDAFEGTSYCKNADGATFQVKHDGECQTLGTLGGGITGLAIYETGWHEIDLESRCTRQNRSARHRFARFFLERRRTPSLLAWTARADADDESCGE
jgi:hypothetical protein